MSTVPNTQKMRSRRVALGLAGASIAVAVGGVVLPRVLRRAEAPAVPSVTAPVVRTVAEGEAGAVGDLTITEEAMQLAEIKVAPVSRRVVNEKLALSGVVEAGGDRIAKITPRVAGKVTRVSAVVGDTVRAGQALALIESSELAQAQAAYQQANARVAAATTNLERQRKLAELGAFGQPQLEEARTRAVDAEQQIHDALHHLQTEKAELAEAQSEQRALRAVIAQADTQVEVAKSRAGRAATLFKEQLVARQELEQTQAELGKTQADAEVARANLARGEARIASAKAQVDAAEGEYELARKRGSIAAQGQARQEKVYQGRYLTSKELVEAEAALRQARLDQQAAGQGVRLLGGRPGGGSVVAVTSPISGRVQERKVSLGETVDTEHGLFTVVNLDTVWAQLQVAPRDLQHIREGQRVELTSETAPGRVFTGRVSSIGSAADETTRAVPVRVALDNRGGALRPGAFVRGNAVTDVRRERIVVPVKAIQEHTNKKTVYVAASDKPGDFEVRHVVLGANVGNGQREVAKGLTGDEKIAVTGTFYLKSEALKSSLSDGCCAVPGAGEG